MRVTVGVKTIGSGNNLYHVTVYGEDLSGEHGTMLAVLADNLAQALYLAWANEHEDEPFDIEAVDGYLIGTVEHHL